MDDNCTIAMAREGNVRRREPLVHQERNAPVHLSAADSRSVRSYGSIRSDAHANSFLNRFLDAAAHFFARICQTTGAFVLRVLSFIVLVAGIIGAVMLQMLGYYYLGVLNVNPLLAVLFYLPTLASLALLREEIRKRGTSLSGLGPERGSRAAALAYMVIIAASAMSILHPIWLRGENVISARSLWTCIGGTAFLYLMLLFSELSFAAAQNLYRAGRHEADEEANAGLGRQADAADLSDSDTQTNHSPVPSSPVSKNEVESYY